MYSGRICTAGMYSTYVKSETDDSLQSVHSNSASAFSIGPPHISTKKMILPRNYTLTMTTTHSSNNTHPPKAIKPGICMLSPSHRAILSCKRGRERKRERERSSASSSKVQYSTVQYSAKQYEIRMLSGNSDHDENDDDDDDVVVAVADALPQSMMMSTSTSTSTTTTTNTYWVCSACTFENSKATATICEMCATRRRPRIMMMETDGAAAAAAAAVALTTTQQHQHQHQHYRLMMSQKKTSINKQPTIVDLTGAANTSTSTSSTNTSVLSGAAAAAASTAGAASRKRKAPSSSSSVLLLPLPPPPPPQLPQLPPPPTSSIHSFFAPSSSKPKAKTEATHPSSSKASSSSLPFPFPFPVYTVPKSHKFTSTDISNTLQQVFGMKSLRPNLQQQAIQNAIGYYYYQTEEEEEGNEGKTTKTRTTRTTIIERQSQLLLLATGGGKSLCYQLPACLLGGVTIVVSPLIALMQDQVQAFNKMMRRTNNAYFMFPAACVSSQQTAKQNQQVLERVLYVGDDSDGDSGGDGDGDSGDSDGGGGKVKKKKKDSTTTTTTTPLTLLYITPESIQTDRMRQVLDTLHAQKRLTMFAIDEAHCVSSWGHDFRPAYRRLSYLRTKYPDVPCMACTATATPQVVQDIQSILHLEKAPLLQGSFDRPNIFYKVKYKDSFLGTTGTSSTGTASTGTALQDMVSWIVQQHVKAQAKKELCSGIVYVHKREDTTFIAQSIMNEAAKIINMKTKMTGTGMIRAAPYHAGLKKEERNRVLEEWSSSSLEVAVATVAFGMGIDLAHVRYVIHWTLPKTVEGFYQESGRAGRDGLPSHSILYYSADDVSKFQYLIRMQSSSSRSKDHGDDTCDNEQCERKLQGLEQMVKYCTTAACRRNALIRHFGGATATPVECQKTCDYCRNPSRVERKIQSAMVVRDVLGGKWNKNHHHHHHHHQNRTKYNYGDKKKSNNDHWNDHGLVVDDDDEEGRIARDWGDDDGMVGDLKVFDGSGDGGESSRSFFNSKKPSSSLGGIGGGFVRASSILDKYERMESRADTKKKGTGGDGGDDDFQQRSSSRVPIPEHFRSALTHKPIVAATRKKPPPLTSQDHAQNADKLRKELEELNAERERRMKALMEKRKKTA